MWTREDLQELIDSELRGAKFIVVSNREPYTHIAKNGQIECLRPASGMATALDPILRASGGVWVAHGSGNADSAMVDEFDHVFVPPGNPMYTLRRVWLDKKLETEYYYGLANEGLWPLCHISFHRPVFRPQDWESYREANRIFADAVLEEAGGGRAFVFIQDYHFGLLPRMLKNSNPNLTVAQFWHIPWPNREIFRAFPWKEELLDGMLGNDLLGFHLRHHCTNFLDTIDRGLEALVDIEHFDVLRNGRTTMVRPFPISIDFEHHTRTAASPQADFQMEIWRERLGIAPDEPEPLIGVGVDRLDYTKGIPDRLRGFDLFLERNPEYRGRIVFVQVGVPSRVQIDQYHALNEEVDCLVAEINAKWATPGWRPILFFKRHFSQIELMALHRLSTFALVSSLHDGMNLVAKEYVASRFDEDGVLILSEFTGSARELPHALIINPFACGEIAEAIARAVQMRPEERRRRMRRLRRAVADNNIYRWASRLLSTLFQLEPPDEANETEDELVNSASAGVSV